MRTPATAAREAVEGKDETLWQRCAEWLRADGFRHVVGHEDCLRAISFMSPEERRLYDIQER